MRKYIYYNEPDEEVGYVRCQVLNFFSFFNVSKTDSSALLLELENIDKTYNQTSTVKQFSAHYCEDLSGVLNLFWENYEPFIFSPIKAKNVDSYTSKLNTLALPALLDSNITEEAWDPSYIHFINFLFFIFSVSDKEMSLFIYWLWFYKPQIKPSKSYLLNLINVIWDSAGVNIEETLLVREKVSKAFTIIDFSTMNWENFQIYDLQHAGLWSKWPIKMKNKLKQKLLGNNFWKKVTASYFETIKDPKVSLERISDKKKIRKTYQDKGERKNAKKVLKRIIKLVNTFFEMKMLKDDNSLTFNNTGTSFSTQVINQLKKIINYNPIRFSAISARIFPVNNTTEILHRLKEQQKNKNKMHVNPQRVREYDIAEDDDDLQYLESLEVTVEELRNRVKLSSIAATDLLEACKRDPDVLLVS